ncbi:hypothetical protein CVM73_19330 [Bradyrhizobium forestalis]|uniref:Uncharacterized protein n=1 Tax=Bradyrhizobium forestalis TaxID=1419263 RepID=A0A2M8R752_9BRAD|nr:hypothetical protein CVM73_19330 [Bradyrhizobium forestalis]
MLATNGTISIRTNDFFKREGKVEYAQKDGPKRSVMRDAVAEPRSHAGREAQHQWGQRDQTMA